MATTKEHIIQYCKDHNFKLREEDFDGSIHQYSKFYRKPYSCLSAYLTPC